MRKEILFAALSIVITTQAYALEEKSVASSLAVDLLVEIRHLNGDVEKFGQEIAGMDIVVAPDSSIQYVHLVLVTGAEKDTHAWYNYRQLAGFRYQFKSITGKGKVKIKQLGRFPVIEKTGMQESIPTIEIDDFK
jgi:hypothetical protein